MNPEGKSAATQAQGPKGPMDPRGGNAKSQNMQSSRTATENAVRESVNAMHSQPMSGYQASRTLGADKITSGRNASQAFGKLMPGQYSPAYKGAMVSSNDIEPIALRRNNATNQWEAAPIKGGQAPSDVANEKFMPLDQMAKEHGAESVSMAIGEYNTQHAIQPGESFSVSGGNLEFDNLFRTSKVAESESMQASETQATQETKHLGSTHIAAAAQGAPNASSMQKAGSAGSKATVSGKQPALGKVSAPAHASAAQKSTIPARETSSVVRSDIFGAGGHYKAIKVGKNSMEGYYHNPKTNTVSGFTAHTITPEEFHHNPKNAVMLNDGTYMRFKTAEENSQIAKAASHMKFNGFNFYSSQSYRLDSEGKISRR